MRMLSLAVVAAASMGAAAESADRNDSAAPTRRLGVVFVDVEGLLPPMARASLRDEATRTLHAAGIELDWQRAEPGAAFDDRTYKLLLVGRAPGGLRQRCAMGSVIAGPGAPRAAWLYLETVLATLRLRRETGALALSEARDLGLALGKIAAHELVHGLAPGLPHASSGLMSASMGRTMLLAESLPVDALTRAVLAPGAAFASNLAAAAAAAPF